MIDLSSSRTIQRISILPLVLRFFFFSFGCKLVDLFSGLMFKICRICSAHLPKHTVKSTHCPRKFNRRTQLTLNSSTVAPDGRLTTNEATPSLERVTLFLDSKSDVSWFPSTVCALRVTGTPPTTWSSESLTCTCLSE